jgi:hypothetical protein
LKNNAHLTGIMNFFKEISKNKNDDIRCYFLFNLPALNKLVDKNIYFNYRHVFLEFARSKNEKIRYYWVEILEDMIEFMPEEDRLNLVKPLLDGLYECETDGAILELLLAKWVAFFKCFYAHEEENSLVKLPHNPKNPVKVRRLFNQVKEKKSKFMSIARIMAAKIKNLNKWRLMKEFIIKLDEITKVEYINGFLPDILEILVECIKRSVEEVRREAVKLYCRVIIHLPKFDQRKTAVKIFYDELIKEATFHNKLSFLLFVEESMKVFSKPALRYYVLPQALMYYNEKAVSLKINLIRLMPDLIDAIDPKDEVINKKFQTMKKSFEDMNVKQIKEALIEATNKIQLRMRSKVYQIEVAKRYKENRELEESLLSTQYEDVSLEEIYKKEGNVTGKGSTATKMLKTIPTKVPVMKKLASQDIKEEKDEPKGVSSTGKPLISNLTNSKKYSIF